MQVVGHDHAAELASGQRPRLGFQIAGEDGEPSSLHGPQWEWIPVYCDDRVVQPQEIAAVPSMSGGDIEDRVAGRHETGKSHDPLGGRSLAVVPFVAEFTLWIHTPFTISY